MVTARGAVEQRVEGLDRGADATKPFSLEELLARVRAQLLQPRTTGGLGAWEGRGHPPGPAHPARGTRRPRGQVDRARVRVAGLPRPHQVLSREQILNAVWGYDFDPGTKVSQASTSAICGASSETAAKVRSRRCATSATASVLAVAERLLPGGLRAQVTLAIARITALATGLWRLPSLPHRGWSFATASRRRSSPRRWRSGIRAWVRRPVDAGRADDDGQAVPRCAALPPRRADLHHRRRRR